MSTQRDVFRIFSTVSLNLDVRSTCPICSKENLLVARWPRTEGSKQVTYLLNWTRSLLPWYFLSAEAFCLFYPHSTSAYSFSYSFGGHLWAFVISVPVLEMRTRNNGNQNPAKSIFHVPRRSALLSSSRQSVSNSAHSHRQRDSWRCKAMRWKPRKEFVVFFPQQRKLKGSSAQTSSGVFRCGSQEQVPEAGSGRFRRVPVCAGGSGEFRCVLV